MAGGFEKTHRTHQKHQSALKDIQKLNLDKNAARRTVGVDAAIPMRHCAAWTRFRKRPSGLLPCWFLRWFARQDSEELLGPQLVEHIFVREQPNRALKLAAHFSVIRFARL